MIAISYAPVTSWGTTTKNGRGQRIAGFFTPISSIGEARRVLVSPFIIALHGIEYNARCALMYATHFLHNGLDHITRLHVCDFGSDIGNAFLCAASLVVTVAKAVYDTIIAALTITARAVMTLLSWGGAGLEAAANANKLPTFGTKSSACKEEDLISNPMP